MYLLNGTKLDFNFDVVRHHIDRSRDVGDSICL